MYREISEQRRAKASQLNTIQNQIVQKKKIKRRSELCLAEVDQLPETTTSYKAVGRMYEHTETPQTQGRGIDGATSPPCASLTHPRLFCFSPLSRFVSCPLPQIKTDLQGLITKSDEDIAKYEPQEKHMERELAQLDKNLEEIADGNEAKSSQ